MQKMITRSAHRERGEWADVTEVTAAREVPRRGLLVAAGVAGATAAVTTGVGAPGLLARSVAAPPRPSTNVAGAVSRSRRTLSADPALHLARRATWGATPELVADIRRKGNRAWLEEQLAPTKVSDTACAALISKHFPRLGWSIAKASTVEDLGWALMDETTLSTITRAIWSKRQLFEVMVDFWSNHLNVTCPSDGVEENRHLYDRDVIRKHAMGRFKDMLVASAKHPSMLVYLNQAESTKDAPNENYGREVLELHTVSVDGGYDEEDIYASAKILTGMTLRNPRERYHWRGREYFYDTSIHWTKPVTVLGQTFNTHGAAGGEADATTYLVWLARHPKTATFLATKLARRFVSDNPPAGLVSRLAAVYRANDTAIVPVLRALFTSREFAMSAERKVRRPFEDVVATVRGLGLKASTNPDVATGDAPEWRDGLWAIYWRSRDMGQAPLYWGPPDGYPDVATSWQSASGLLGRWDAHYSIAHGYWPSRGNKHFGWPDRGGRNLHGLLPATLPKTYGGLVDALALRLLHQQLRADHRAAVLAFMEHASTEALADNSSWLDWRLPQLVSLLLDSPYHEMR